MNPSTLIDSELQAVAAEILKFDPNGFRTAQVLRDTLDQLYDGQRTGRYKWDQLYKTEKTHCGTLVEINLQREFEFKDGTNLDYQIAGVEVDCKYSQRLNNWMIPPEAIGHLCLVVWAEDSKNPTWCMGLVRVTPACLNTNGNRDGKTTLNEAGRNSITWLFKDAPLPPNVLLQLDHGVVEKIMALKSGQKRVNELFRVAMGMIVGRAVVATAGEQADYMRRIRYNGGARTPLGKEGIIILGQYKDHVAIARALGVATPGAGEFVSVRVVEAVSPGTGVAEIGGSLWRVAQVSDPVVTAPKLPKI
ncbi:MAG: Restriction endonuclease [Pedosphaera sp.]|nr:Restriction endonuclease [Pedosphaera sp.]